MRANGKNLRLGFGGKFGNQVSLVETGIEVPMGKGRPASHRHGDRTGPDEVYPTSVQVRLMSEMGFGIYT